MKKPKKPKQRIPVAKPGVRHKSKKDYNRKYNAHVEWEDSTDVEVFAENKKEAERLALEGLGFLDGYNHRIVVSEVEAKNISEAKRKAEQAMRLNGHCVTVVAVEEKD